MSKQNLTSRQTDILRTVIREYRRTGRPVGSRAIVELGVVDAKASTIRNELAQLEDRGLLQHPHTSAGRVPTPAGYRYFVDEFVTQDRPQQAKVLRADVVTSQIDTLMQGVAEAVSQTTNLASFVTAPIALATSIRHVEVIQAQAEVIVVVVITDSGDVVRHRVMLDHAVDPGLVTWAGQYLNERLVGQTVGRHAINTALNHPDLSGLEHGFLQELSPAFVQLVDDQAEVFAYGQPHLVEHLKDEPEELADVLGVLDTQTELIGLIRRMTARSDMAIAIGPETGIPALSSLSVVAGAYGVGARQLGGVSVVGPQYMDYRHAAASVREASLILSQAVDGIYS